MVIFHSFFVCLPEGTSRTWWLPGWSYQPAPAPKRTGSPARPSYWDHTPSHGRSQMVTGTHNQWYLVDGCPRIPRVVEQCGTWLQKSLPINDEKMINGHAGQEPRNIGGTDSICKAYFSGLCKGIYPQNMARNMAQHLHFRILEFPLILPIHGRSQMVTGTHNHQPW